MTKSDIKVGDEVVITGQNIGTPLRQKVTRVGRIYVYVEIPGRGGPTGFSKETGRENTDYLPRMLHTLDEWAVEQRRLDALRRLADHKIRHQNYSFPQSVETLEKIADLLDQDSGAEA